MRRWRRLIITGLALTTLAIILALSIRSSGEPTFPYAAYMERYYLDDGDQLYKLDIYRTTIVKATPFKSAFQANKGNWKPQYAHTDQFFVHVNNLNDSYRSTVLFHSNEREARITHSRPVRGAEWLWAAVANRFQPKPRSGVHLREGVGVSLKEAEFTWPDRPGKPIGKSK